MFLQMLKNIIAESLRVEVALREIGNDAYHVDVPFYFADGDVLRVVLKKAPNGSWLLTDEGHTLTYLRRRDVDVEKSQARQLLFQKALSSYSIENRDGCLVIAGIRFEGIPDAIAGFARGILQVSDRVLWEKDCRKHPISGLGFN
jgi:hypothetical protein